MSVEKLASLVGFERATWKQYPLWIQ